MMFIYADATDHQRDDRDGRNQQCHGAGRAFNHFFDAVAVVHEKVFRAVPRFSAARSVLFRATWVLAFVFDLTVIELVWLSPVIWCITVV